MIFTERNIYSNILVEERVQRAQAGARDQNSLSHAITQLECQAGRLLGKRTPSWAEAACQMAS